MTTGFSPYRPRPLHYLIAVLLFVFLGYAAIGLHAHASAVRQRSDAAIWDVATAGLGLTDLCVATEARYTRHPAVSDPIAPFMDHPGAIEHFPTGSFWAVSGMPAAGEKH